MAESIAQTQQRLTAYIQANFPTADVTPGSALSELVVKLAATLQNQIYNSITTLSQVSSVQAALESTTPTITPTIDEVASNYNVTRFAGTYSTGNLKTTLATNQGIIISQGAQFIQPNLNLTYQTTQTYSYSNNSSTTNGLLPIYSQNGTYYIIVPVQASTVGSQYQVSDQTQFTLGTNITNSNIVTVAAYGNFSSGLPEDTDQQLISKFQTSLANSTLFSSASITNYLTNNFSGFQQVSVIGANDPEMVRSKENLFGISTFGMADLYVRTSVGSSSITITKTATKLTAASASSPATWQVNILNIDCPGFYSIAGILPAPVNNTVNSAGTLVINSTTYGYSQLSNQRNNQINSVADAMFSSYQSAVVIFQYTDPTGVAVGSTLSFNITFLYQPNILPIQQVFLNDATRPISSDYLVKAMLPCFCTVNITLARKNTTDTAASIGVSTLQQSIYNYINGLPFGASVAASEIVNLCYELPISRVVLPIQLTGNIYTINQTNILLTSADELVIPTNIPNGVSPNTTGFLIDYYTPTLGNVTPNNNIIINLV